MFNYFLHFLLPLLLISSALAANVMKKQSPAKQPGIQQQQQQQQPQANVPQYMQESELPSEQPEIKAEEDEQTYQMLHELKQDSRLPGNNYPWNQQTNPYENQSPQAAASLAMPKMLPFIGYAQPVLIPFPLYIAPDMFYPAYPGASNDLEEMAMSRSAGDRRASSTAHGSRNSPIYYVRLPPTPYMFVPTNLAAPTPFGSAFSPLLTYQPMPTFSSYGSVFNLPVNFVANGKPSGIYQMHNAANELASFTTGLAGGFNMRPPTPSNPFNYRPISPPAAAQQSFGLAALPVPQQDSKLTSLKRPFVFNGRPEDIYILPNNMNPLYNYNEPNYY